MLAEAEPVATGGNPTNTYPHLEPLPWHQSLTNQPPKVINNTCVRCTTCFVGIGAASVLLWGEHGTEVCQNLLLPLAKQADGGQSHFTDRHNQHF